MALISSVFIIFWFITVIFANEIIIETSINVAYRGRIVEENQKRVGIFLKIPYAKPPVGPLRFTKPQPFEYGNSTQMIIDANGNFSLKCIQPFATYNETEQSEDCLYLNVFTPRFQPNDTKLYSVMVWIHGGAFVSGSASDFSIQGIIQNLVSRGVVVVTINYRLGPFGFWNTKSSVVSGNFGLWDQVLALKWVRSNIQSFGGDSSKVTIFGESAGGASVSLLTLSPAARDLFQQAIMMSGSGLAHWALTYDEDINDPSGYLSEDLNFRPTITRKTKSNCFSKHSNFITDSKILKQHQRELEGMKQKSTLDILKTAKPPGSKSSSVHTIWTPRIDGEFLTNSPEILLESRPPYTFMIGITKEDGGMFGFYDRAFTREKFENEVIPASIDCQVSSSPEIVQSVVRYKYSYMAVPPIDKNDERNFWMKQDSKMKTNTMFLIPAYKDAIGALATNSSVYMFSWDYIEAGELYNSLDNFYYKGPFHSTELKYLFDVKNMFTANESISKKKTTYDEDAVNVLGTLWTNFAKFGNPTPSNTLNGLKWIPMSLNSSNYLSIDMPVSRMVEEFYHDDVTFWYKLVPQLENISQRCAVMKI